MFICFNMFAIVDKKYVVRLPYFGAVVGDGACSCLKKHVFVSKLFYSTVFSCPKIRLLLEML